MRSRIAVVVALAVMVAGGPALAQQPQTQGPTLGATLSPSRLELRDGTASATTRIQNGGSIPVAISAQVNLPRTRVAAAGWSVAVDGATLQPGQWAEVTIALGDAPPSDVSLDIRMGPVAPLGMETVVLRFPVTVTVKAATPASTAQAWGRSLAAWLLGRSGVL